MPHRGKNADYVTVLIPKSYLVILKGYLWCKIEDLLLCHTHLNSGIRLRIHTSCPVNGLNDVAAIQAWGRLTMWQTRCMNSFQPAISKLCTEHGIFSKHCDTSFQCAQGEGSMLASSVVDIPLLPACYNICRASRGRIAWPPLYMFLLLFHTKNFAIHYRFLTSKSKCVVPDSLV